MARVEKLPLKDFWNAVEARLAKDDADDLRNIVRALAQDLPPAERRAFLDQLKPTKDVVTLVQQARRQAKLLSEIDDLAREIRDAIKHADEWEDHHGWNEYYDDEDSLGPYEEFVEPLTALFKRARRVFNAGNVGLARAAYQKLFAVLELEDDYGRGVRAEDLGEAEMGEAHARYLRSIFESESPEQRPHVLFERMQHIRPRMLLTDVMQIAAKPLSAERRFLDDWIAFLRRRKGEDADIWLREAIRLARGTSGLAELAQKEGKTRPRAYLDWLAALEQAKRYRAVRAAAQEALRILPERLPIRAAVADYLYRAAAQLHERAVLRHARWEAFHARPTLARLLDLWDVTAVRERASRMRAAAKYLKNYLAHPPQSWKWLAEGWSEDNVEAPAWIERSVLAHAYLFAAEWDAATQLAARDQTLVWHGGDNPPGLVVAYCLVQLSGKSLSALRSNLKQVWQWGLAYSVGFHGFGTDDRAERRILKQLQQVYAEVLSAAVWTPKRQEHTLAWCVEFSEKRVKAVVSGQHRGRYAEVAALLGACAEMLRARGQPQAAAQLVQRVRDRFLRHRAFQTALDAAVP